MADSSDSAATPIRIHQPSPLAAEAAYSPNTSLLSGPSPQSSRQSLEHERQYAAAKRTEAHEDAEELRNFRMLALERQKASGGSSAAGAQGGLGGAFEPFVGSRVGSPIPDKHGLGWPGASSRFLAIICRIPLTRPSSPGKGTLARLNATPEERTAREQKLADAVKVLLECIGEDPERDGLIKTPERYAKALLWMTKGYEERLPGAHSSWARSLIPC